MDRDNIEFLISQYLDEQLPAKEQERVARLVVEDPSAREIFAAYRALDTVLKSAPVPSVNFDRLNAAITSRIDEIDAEPASYGTLIRPLPVRQLAIAAGVLLAVGVGVVAWMQSGQRGGSVESSALITPVVGSISVSGPTVASVSTGASIQVSIGPSPSALTANAWHPAEEVVTRQPRVVIASGLEDLSEVRHPLAY